MSQQQFLGNVQIGGNLQVGGLLLAGSSEVGAVNILQVNNAIQLSSDVILATDGSGNLLINDSPIGGVTSLSGQTGPIGIVAGTNMSIGFADGIFTFDASGGGSGGITSITQGSNYVFGPTVQFLGDSNIGIAVNGGTNTVTFSYSNTPVLNLSLTGTIGGCNTTSLTADGYGNLLVGGNAVTLSETFNSLVTTVTNLSTYTYGLVAAPLIQSGIVSIPVGEQEIEVSLPVPYENSNYNIQLTLANDNNLATMSLWWGRANNSSHFVITLNNPVQADQQDFFWLTNGSSAPATTTTTTAAPPTTTTTTAPQ